MKRKPLLICIAAVILIAGIAAFYGFRGKTSSSVFFAMDTYCSVKAEGKDAEKVCDRSEEITLALESDYLSRQRDSSEISALNRNGGGDMSSRFSGWIETLLEVSEKSSGSFDFTLGALSDLWGFGNNPSVPSDSEIKSVLEKCGIRKISVDESRISFPEGVVLDAGASGKGIALDEIKENCLDSSDIRSAVISIGGSVLLYGNKTFRVGIRNPETGNGEAAVLSVDGCFVSTSGSYERFFEEDGRRYHHILDPKTGYPAENGLVSVTIVAGSGILSDALSTACFVLGPEEGMKLVLDYGCEAVFIDSEGGITVSQGLADRITVTDDNFFVR